MQGEGKFIKNGNSIKCAWDNDIKVELENSEGGDYIWV